MATNRIILAVDDDEGITDFIQMALEPEGYRVVAAKDGWTAFERLGDFVPALILLDVRMPEMNGWEFADVYRQLPGWPVPIVVMTGEPGSFESPDWMRVDGYLQKPFGVTELTEVANKYAPVESN